MVVPDEWSVANIRTGVNSAVVSVLGSGRASRGYVYARIMNWICQHIEHVKVQILAGMLVPMATNNI